MRIYDTWEAVKKYTSLGWDAFLNPNTEKSEAAREQIVNKIKSAMKDVVVKYLLPGLTYSIAGYTAFKNIINPFGFVSELARPFRYGMRRMGGGFRTNVANFNEARTELRNAALSQLQLAGYMGLQDVNANLRGGALRITARTGLNGLPEDLTEAVDQGRLMNAASTSLMQRNGVSRATAERWLESALRGKGFTYGISRMFTAFGNGLRRITSIMSMAAKGLSWGFNIGTTMYAIYKVWNMVKEKYNEANSNVIFKSISDFALYTVKKGWNTLVESATAIAKELPYFIGTLTDTVLSNLKKSWPEYRAKFAYWWDNDFIPSLKNIGSKTLQWLEQKAKKLVGQDDASLATKRLRDKIVVSDDEIKTKQAVYNNLSVLNNSFRDFYRGLDTSQFKNMTEEQIYEKAKDLFLQGRTDLDENSKKYIKNLLKTSLTKRGVYKPDIYASEAFSNTDVPAETTETIYGGLTPEGIKNKKEEDLFRKLFLPIILDKSMFMGHKVEKGENGEISVVPDNSQPFEKYSSYKDILLALKADKNDSIAKQALSNLSINLSNKENFLQGSLFRDLIEELKIYSEHDVSQDKINSLIFKILNSEDKIVRDMHDSFRSNNFKLYTMAEKYEDLPKLMLDEIKKSTLSAESAQMEQYKQTLAIQEDEAKKRRALEEQKAAEAAAKAEDERNRKATEEKQSIWDSVKNFFGFDKTSSSGGAGSLGVIAQWVQSGKFKQVMETAMGWIGDKIGGIIKFFKSQNYGKIFADTMSGLGSASGAILSALYGADKADTFSRNAYNYAVKHNLKYAKAFFGGARKSILTGVEDLVSHAAKTNQRLTDILDFLQTQGTSPDDLAGKGGLHPIGGDVSKYEKDFKQFVSPNGQYVHNEYDDNKKFDIAFAETFAREGAGINEKERYKGTSRMLSRYGILAINLPGMAKNDQTLKSILTKHGITTDNQADIWRNWEGSGGYRNKFKAAMHDSEFTKWGETTGKAKDYFKTYWDKGNINNFKDTATAGILLNIAYNGGIGGMLEVLGNVFNSYNRKVDKVSWKGKDGKIHRGYPSKITTDPYYVDFANARDGDFAARLLTEQRARFRRIYARDHTAPLAGWLKRTENTARFYGFALSGDGETFINPKGRVTEGLRPEVADKVIDNAVKGFRNNISESNFSTALHGIKTDTWKKSLLGNNISDDSYNKVLKFNENYGNTVQDVARIRNKDTEKVSQNEAERMAELVQVLSGFIKTIDSKDSANATLIHNFTQYNNSLTSRLGTIMSKEKNRLDVTKIKDKMIESAK